jgi:predicted DNA-binding transcriptional regulator AlpA
MKTFSRPRAVSLRLGIPISSLYEKIANDPTFPKPIQYGNRAVAFDDEELLRWQLERIADRNHLIGAERESWIEEQSIREQAKQDRIAVEKLRNKPRGANAKKQSKLMEAAE